MLKQLLEPRDEVMNGRLQSVIDLERVADPRRRALESRPRDFLACTYVSGEIRRLVEGLNKRLTSAEAGAGLSPRGRPQGRGKIPRPRNPTTLGRLNRRLPGLAHRERPDVFRARWYPRDVPQVH